MSYFSEFQRKRLLKKVQHDVVRLYLQTPLPELSKSVLDTEFVALDFETTGLDAGKDAVLSVGFSLIRQGKITLKDNLHFIIRIQSELTAESVVIHKITHDRMQQGKSLEDVLELLLRKLCGRVLLVHYAAIEREFLNASFEKIYGFKLPMLVVDTLEIEKNYWEKAGKFFVPKQLRLFNLRAEYGLPRYNAHNALEDAIATAELFLAQIHSRQSAGTHLCLRDVLI